MTTISPIDISDTTEATIPPHGGWYRVADLFCLVGAILNGVNLVVAVHRKIRAEGAP